MERKAVRHFLFRSTWSLIDRIVALITVFGVAFILGQSSIGRIEGALFPVVDNFEVERVLPLGGGEAEVSGSFEINRPRCNFVAVKWYVVSDTREALIDVHFRKGAVAREGREQTFSQWIIGIPAKAIRERTRADVLHQCPGRPWITRTPIFP